MRAAYFLRQEYDNYTKNIMDTSTGQDADEKKTEYRDDKDGDDISMIIVNTLAKSLADNRHGSLLRHELAYVLGQIRDQRAIPALENTLLNVADDTMVRHECAEALGAIGSHHSIPSLEKCANDDASVEVGETCRLALNFLSWKLNDGVEGDDDTPIACACMLSPYSSVDPAPPHPKHVALSSEEIGLILRDESAPMFERFRAMFSLRNRGGLESVKELGKALGERWFYKSSSFLLFHLPIKGINIEPLLVICKVMDKSSALLRHEVAYVLGQMQHPDSVEYLATSLKRQDEHRMVRHESAEALGAIEERWGECETILEYFLNDEDDVVRESCVVALDAGDYWGYGNGAESAEEKDGFSFKKSESTGIVPSAGVLHNHFNISE
jgi:deoxyhypusine monooxygenase